MNDLQSSSLWTSLAQMIASSLTTALVGAGILSSDQSTQAISIFFAVISGVGMYLITQYKKKSLNDAALRAAVAKSPDTVLVVTKPSIANSDEHSNDNKIVTPAQAVAQLPLAAKAS